MIDGVVFDLDGTLVDRDLALVEWALSRAPSAERSALERAAARHPDSALAFAREISEHAPSRAALEAALPRFVCADPLLVRALRELGRAIPLAVLTNGSARVQRAKLRAAGLEGCFEAVVVSAEIGVRKPDERAFHAALRALGVAAARALFVGDREEVDLAPARAMGAATERVRGDRGIASPSAFRAPILALCERLLQSGRGARA